MNKNIKEILKSFKGILCLYLLKVLHKLYKQFVGFRDHFVLLATAHH